MKEKNTDELRTELDQADSLEQFLSDNSENFKEPDFSELLEKLMREKKLKKAILAKRSGMSEVYLYQLLSGRRNPSRSRMICLCIGLQADLEESQELLRQSGMAALYPRNRRDAVIMYGIAHRMDIFQINDLLFEADENTLF